MANQGGQQNADSTYDMLYVIGAVILLIVGAWFFFHTGLTRAVIFIRSVETAIFSVFSDNAANILARLNHVNPAAVDWENMKKILSETNPYARWLCAIPLGALAAWVYSISPVKNYKKVHTMQSLAKSQAALWPEISPVVNLSLLDGDITEGPWAAAMSEREFANKHKLLADQGEKDELGKPLLTLDHKKARQVFDAQLGPRWTGVDALPPYVKGIFAALSLRIAAATEKDPKKVKAMLAESTQHFRDMAVGFAATNSVKGIDFSWTEDVLSRTLNNRLVKKAISNHAYVYTVLPTILQLSRQNGVMAASMFVWLRPTDRRLWYALNNTGGYAFHAECAGIMGHWLAEKSLQHRLIAPTTKYAVLGLDSALREYCDDDSEQRIFL